MSWEDDIAAWKTISAKSDCKFQVMGEAGAELIDVKNILGRPVLGKILILPRSEMMKFTYDQPWACISITDAGIPFPDISEENRIKLLQLAFDDVEFVRDNDVLFSSDNAKEVWDFVTEVWDQIELMVVHCNAGHSRSPAIGKALSDRYDNKQSAYFDSFWMPNQIVYNEMCKEFPA